MSDSIDRSAARAIGATMYKGKPCETHPDSLRYTASKACVECAKAARRLNQHRNTEKDKLRKRAARAAAKQSSMICDVLGL